MSTMEEKKAVIATVQKVLGFAQLLLFISWSISATLACFAENVGFVWIMFNFMGGAGVGLMLGNFAFNIVSMVDKLEGDRKLDLSEQLWYDRFKRWSGSTKNPS